jgi:hypothetical protein
MANPGQETHNRNHGSYVEGYWRADTADAAISASKCMVVNGTNSVRWGRV